MFQPPRCPNRDCPRFRRPEPRFFHRNGHFRARCRPASIPRFRCKTCGKGFSRQTFRMDYRDHRPALNPRLFRLLASGIGLRQSARVLGLSLRCTELKFRKIARHLRRLQLNLRGDLPPTATLQFDEFETYEEARNARPLSVPVLIERDSRYVIWSESAPIRPHGRRSRARERAIRRAEARHGPRKDLSRRGILRTLRRGAELARKLRRVQLDTDEKPSYASLARSVFGRDRLVHRKTNSRVARTTWNPLFAVNHTEAMMRDLTGRVRRDSWLISKKRRYLDLGLALWSSWRNYVRRRFNRDSASPAQLLGFAPRRLTEAEMLGWRQDWGRDSIPTVPVVAPSRLRRVPR